ncbi:O-antigen ligase family protein [Virgibacillus litoralis]|nr:O-antigen ligase family protein [Virgibacillus litoralis]
MFLYQWITLDFPLLKFKSFFRNPNALGAVLLVFSYFLILRTLYSNHITKIFNTILILITLFLIYSSTSRTVWLSLLFILLAWVIYNYSYNKFKYLFPVTLIFSLLFSIFYVFSFNTVLGDFMDKLSKTLFGKSLYSGREILWNDLFNHSLNAPFLGYGYGTNFNEMNSRGQSPHNMYLQIMLESGVIGLIIFILVLYFLWKMLLKNIGSTAAQLSAFYFIGFLVYLNFETTIFPASIVAIGIFQWLIITFGTNFKEQDLP